MISYTGYHITLEKLSLLRNQEMQAKRRIKEFERKKLVLDKISGFLAQADRSGPKPEQWDRFPVNIKDRPVSLSDLASILAQTSNNENYIYLPESLSIKHAEHKRGMNSNNMIPDTSSDGPAPAGQTLILSLDGCFLVRNRRPDG